MNRAIGIIAAGLLSSAAPAWAAGGHVSGWGTRAGFAFSGEVDIAATGAATGQFTIVEDVSPTEHISCRYLDFFSGSVTGKLAVFDAIGYCIGPSGPFKSQNRFAIVDRASPGGGFDTIDVNFFGPTGIAIPGGVLATGDFAVTP